MDDIKEKALNEAIAYKYNSYAKAYALEKKYSKAFRYMIGSFIKRKFTLESIYRLLNTSIFIFFPSLFKQIKNIRNN